MIVDGVEHDVQSRHARDVRESWHIALSRDIIRHILGIHFRSTNVSVIGNSAAIIGSYALSCTLCDLFLPSVCVSFEVHSLRRSYLP